MSYEKICVFCGASENVDKKYRDVAEALGAAIGRSKKQLIYGGGDSGLMGVVSRSARSNGAYVKGIFPKCIDTMEKMSEETQGLIIVESLFERKEIMLEQSDAFVILPGGIGTLDELFEVITLKALKVPEVISKPIFVLNFEGYWDRLSELLESVIAERFTKASVKQTYRFVNTMPELLSSLGIN